MAHFGWRTCGLGNVLPSWVEPAFSNGALMHFNGIAHTRVT